MTNLTAAPPPRLAASILRTTSNASMNSTASSKNSVAVNPANSIRAGSPSPSSVSTPQSQNTTPGPVTVDKLDKLERDHYIDGTPKPHESEMIEDPKTPGVHVMKEEHPLQYSCTLYHDSKPKFPYTPAPTSANPTGAAPPLPQSQNPFSHAPGDYEANLTVIGSFTTVEQFCRYFNWLKPPSLLERNSNYHLFKSPIKPMWEDPANASGGKWMLTMRNNPELLDRCWGWLCMALVGEELEEGGDEICGAFWTRRKDDVEKLNAIGKKLVKLLDVGEQDGIGLEFQSNTEDRGDRERAVPNTSFRSTFQGSPVSAAGAPGQHPGVGGPSGGHSHSRSIGGIGIAGTGGFTPVNQTAPPLSAGTAPSGNGAGAFGSFGVPLGSAGWRRRG
ncbi:translation initiation factor eIF4e [Lentinula novae-zelandiae]|nr:translation initiation factor eIF4e [Lentinula novae-zelandiae]